MTKTERLASLFKEWQENKKYEIFCQDGIVDEVLYSKQTIKVLYILKDLHLKEEYKCKLLENGMHSIDIRREGLEDGVGRTWNPLALWSKAWIDINPKSYKDIEAEIKNKEHLRKNYIEKISFLNVKKDAGKSSVTDEIIREYINDAENIKYIKQEIAICSPDLIIVCGVNLYDDLINPMNLKNEKNIDTLNKMRKLSYMEIGDKKIPVLQFRHPSRSGSYKQSYSDMLKIRNFIFGK